MMCPRLHHSITPSSLAPSNPPTTLAFTLSTPPMNPRLPPLALAACLTLSPLSRADEPLVKPLEVRKVYDNGKHNAFTAMRRFKGDLYLAFRAADSHNSPA